MKTRISLSVLLLLICVFMVACGSAKSLGSTLAIKGKLHKGDLAISKASITLYDPNVDTSDPAYKVAETETDGKGQYSLKSVKPGIYTLAIMISKPDFSNLPCKSTGAFALDADVWAQEVVLRLNDGSGVLSLEIKQVELVAGKVTERNIDLTNCQ
jgi:hypothetical protein